MARRGDASDRVDWYLRQWMATLGVRQVDMINLTGWSKATASQLMSGKQNFSPKVLTEAANALNVKPYELLLLPEDAMALRQLRGAAAAIVSIAPPEPDVVIPIKRSAGG